MQGLINGFGLILIIGATGFFIGRTGLLGDTGVEVLSRLVYYIATPCLMFSIIAPASLRDIFSPGLGVIFLSSLILSVSVITVTKVIGKWSWQKSTIGGLSVSYVNSGNLGIALAAYILGDITMVAGIILLQLTFYAPIALSFLDYKAEATSDRRFHPRDLLNVFRNPLLMTSLVAITFSLLPIELPPLILTPVTHIGQTAIVLALLAFGMSFGASSASSSPLTEAELSGSQAGQSSELSPTTLAQTITLTTLKNLVHPLIAFVLATSFSLDRTTIFTVTLLAALPTAQNIYIYAQRYRGTSQLARNVVAFSTVACVPIMFVISLIGLHT